MSDQDRAPVIRLPVDQEVFIETVREGDVVDDATVATEIVSFERVGDAYVLEGAVVFAGYLSRSEEQAGTSLEPTFSVEMEEDFVEHVHHRMPFILRVPVKAQQRGMLNVKSRLSSWSLNVVGTGWMRVQGDLHVVGLNGDEGYHFECAGQELGSIFFNEQPDEPPQESSPEVENQQFALVDPADVRSIPPEESSDFRDFGGANQVQDEMEAVSEARGGHGWSEQTENEHADVPARETGEPSSREIRAADELSNLDRFFASDKQSGGSEPSKDRSGRDHTPSPTSNQAANESKVVAEFEFEHQLSAEEISQSEAPTVSQTESFVASRSFVQDGFQATAGFAPTFHINSAGDKSGESVQRSETESMVPLTDDQVQDGAPGVRGEGAVPQQSLWSFVDFNVPETRYTLRYVIVMEEETLETISERLHCTKTELIRVNKLHDESVIPGQTLLVPEVPFTLTR